MNVTAKYYNSNLEPLNLQYTKLTPIVTDTMKEIHVEYDNSYVGECGRKIWKNLSMFDYFYDTSEDKQSHFLYIVASNDEWYSLDDFDAIGQFTAKLIKIYSMSPRVNKVNLYIPHTQTQLSGFIGRKERQDAQEAMLEHFSETQAIFNVF
jgi:hypothetical protein